MYSDTTLMVTYITITVSKWVDVFTRSSYRNIITDSLGHCCSHRGLEIYAWVLMTNHLHLVCSARNGLEDLANIIRDFKKFTSKAVIQAIEDNPQESRRDWLLWLLTERDVK